ncbi:MAG: hypothetical protein K8F33_10440 [Thermomonas sp.]|uniref:hypothetical protein n=1 Tax=Thermomonas sp. TaxID=1971895 RepID=UPI001DF1146D|nr:hypothetical protein [Thermomonas sp.]MBZ0088495.1 hypothetical protein [Thermomonas sp.]MCO5054915.1 hypothetical protein [Thermomonas sp.]
MNSAFRKPFTTLLLGCVCTLLVMLCFWPGLSGEFLLDDGDNIEQNVALHIDNLDLASLEQATYSFVARGGLRILPELTFALDYYNWGLNPFAFKATNLAIHALTMLALAGFFQTLLSARGWQQRNARLAAAAMALAWALHPMQVSTVLYVVQRMQALCTLFLVLALWGWLKMRLAQADGRPGRLAGLIALLCWLLALASKEDAALFPLYVLLLELTLLGFRASAPATRRLLRSGFTGFALIGLLVYLVWVVPHYWRWDAYPGRDFSTLERLLTEGRVLVMYLGQILWPLPSRFPFFYDNFEISRSLVQPWTTLPALLLIAALLALAWRLRTRRPLFAFGVLFFFAGHFMTSNVIGLELVFEHRNQLPLIGIVLAVADLIALLAQRLEPRRIPVYAACALLVAGLGAGTWARASIWGDPTRFAETAPRLAPQSPRAWMTLCLRDHDLSGGDPSNPYFGKAIAACERGGAIGSSAAPLALVIEYKTRNGTVTQADWDAYLERMRHVVMHVENRRSAWILLSRVLAGDRLDPGRVLQALNIVSARAGFTPDEFIVIGYFVLGNAAYADDACQYFEQAIRHLPADDPRLTELPQDLRRRGQEACAETLASAANHTATRSTAR